MPGGIAEFRAKHVSKAEKIDADPALTDGDKGEFWEEVDLWDSHSPIEDHASTCCFKRQFRGAEVPLEDEEQLGTARHRVSMERGFTRQSGPGGAPPMTWVEAQSYMTEVVLEPNTFAALTTFHDHFNGLRIAPLDYGPSTRIFAFRSSENPTSPLQPRPMAQTFAKLSIPEADPAEYVMLAFRPSPGDRVCRPTCFDANMHNLELFETTGLTQGGIPEVVTTPPTVASVTFPPREI